MKKRKQSLKDKSNTPDRDSSVRATVIYDLEFFDTILKQLDELRQWCESHIPNKAREKKITLAISKAFGFGGHNAVLAIRNIVKPANVNPKLSTTLHNSALIY